MRTKPEIKPVMSIVNRMKKNKINPKPQYQRGAVWGESNKQLLIDSILRGYDIPKFYFRSVSGGTYEHEVVDGQQRMRAISEYCQNHFSLGDFSNDIPGQPPLEGKKFDDLDSDLQDEIHAYNLTITEITDASEEEIRELFLRLQEGKALNPAEKRNAIPGNMRDFISKLAEEHSLFGKTNIKNKRFDWDDLAAHVTCLELSKGPTDLKAENLKKMYENNQQFDVNGKEAKKIKSVLNYMSKVLQIETPEMNIKWGFVDLFLALSKLLETHDMKNLNAEVRGIFVSFENERRSVQDETDLLKGSAAQKDMYDYIMAFQREGAKRDNIQTRFNVYLRRIHNDLPNIQAKDSKRSFDENERIIIWRRDNEACKICRKKIPFSKMHVDHIIPYSKGGKTNIENAQSLCSVCNLKKAAS